MKNMELDLIDVRILNLLQENSGIPLRTLAEKVHASPATCQRRISRLRDLRVLLKEVALVDQPLIGRPLTVFVSVELQKQNDVLLKKFEKKNRWKNKCDGLL